MKERLLILTRQVGGGLDTITNNLVEKLKDRYIIEVHYLEDVISKHLDGILMKYWYTSKLDKELGIWDFVYRHDYLHRAIYAAIRVFPIDIVCKQLKNTLLEFNPDKVLGTSFLPSFILSYATKKIKLKATTYGLVSNFDVPKFWDPQIDKILLPHHMLIDVAVNHADMEREQLIVSGLPVSGNVCSVHSTTTLVMGGAWGLCDPAPFLEAIANRFQQEKFAVICGSNADLYENLVAKYQNYKNVDIFPYVEDMNAIYRNAKCIITKPGMLTLAEASLRKIPLLLIDPIPGHEQKNLKFMMNHQAALFGDDTESIIENLQNIYSNECYIEEMKNNAFSIFEKSLHISDDFLEN